MLERLHSCQRGSIAVVSALTIAALVIGVGIAVDYGYVLQQRNRAQSAADAAALASAHELRVANTDIGHLRSIAEQTVSAILKSDTGDVKVEVDVVQEPLSVSVAVAHDAHYFFVDQSETGKVSVSAVARILGGTPLCVLGLDESDTRPAIKLEVNARLTAAGCAVYSNATSEKSVTSKDGSMLEAEIICAAGGTRGSLGNFRPAPTTDCPKMDDPLANRAAPPIGRCTENDFRIGVGTDLKVSGRYIKEQVKVETFGETAKTIGSVDVVEEVETNTFEKTYVTLNPGVYCGGILIGQATHVTFRPGVYVIKGGPLYVTEFASVKGENVGFYFKGRKANLYLGPNTSVELSAPKDGPMAGLLLFEDRDESKLSPFAILSDNARTLEGTLYLPQSRLYIDADSPIADRSAYTAIIAKRLDLYAGPHLVLNSDYNQTDVLVPNGIANANGRLVLTR